MLLVKLFRFVVYYKTLILWIIITLSESCAIHYYQSVFKYLYLVLCDNYLKEFI